MRQKEALTSYYENITHGKDAYPSAVHGMANQTAINEAVKAAVDFRDFLLEQGDMEGASSAESLVFRMGKEVQNAHNLKEEHAASIQTGSNWGDWGFVDNAFTEQCEVSFDENGKMLFTALNPTSGEIETRTIEQMSKDFHEIGDWMQPLMALKQTLLRASNKMGDPPPIDINYVVNNLIKDNWKSMIADPDPTLDPNGPSQGYRLQQILHEAVDPQTGLLPEDFNLDKHSFNPEFDTRLFGSISNDLHEAFEIKTKSKEEEQGEQTTMANKTGQEMNIIGGVPANNLNTI